MLTGGGEEDRDEDDYVRQWWRKDATLASTGGREKDRDKNDYNHCARRWRREDTTSTLTSTSSGSRDNDDDDNDDDCARSWGGRFFSNLRSENKVIAII
jgi:hypothetical protein